MKILYAIQGTGNGHVARALEIVPHLQTLGEVDLLISGSQADISLPFPIRYKLRGLGFVFGKKGGVDLLETFLQARTRVFYREVRDLPVAQYDLVISDFEPVSSWACQMRGVPCIGLSHQAAVLSPNAPRPADTDMVGKVVLRNYAPVTSAYGFHFQSYNAGVFTPVIRRQIRQATVTDQGHYTVYLPSYDDEQLVKRLSEIPQVEWQVFSKHNRKPFRHRNVRIAPVSAESFVSSFTACTGLLCGAGFETPAEALFMGKKLLVIPMKNQYEQHCNAAALAQMGVPVIKNLKKKRVPLVQHWVENAQRTAVNYPDQTRDILRLLVHNHLHGTSMGLAEFLQQAQLA